MTSSEVFGTGPNGETVTRVMLKGGGLSAKVLTWGSIIQDLRLEGHAAPLVLGFDNLPDYLAHSPFFGVTPGRNANRLANGRFSIDGVEYQLERNERGVTHLHGGSDGIASQNWDIVELTENRVVLRGMARDPRRGRELVAPANSILHEGTQFDVGWLCPYCMRNTLRAFDAASLNFREATASPNAA